MENETMTRFLYTLFGRPAWGWRWKPCCHCGQQGQAWLWSAYDCGCCD